VTLWALGLKIFQIFFNQGSFGNIRRRLKDVGKEKIVSKIIKIIKKDIMCARNINVLVGENQISYLKLMELEMISCTKLSI
jgi:hypothetical protein